MSHTIGDVTAEMSAEEPASASVTVKPHATRIVVWDVPTAIETGEKFRLKVGLKCSCACNLEGREFAIYDAEDGHVASGAVGGDPWPGSTALYFADVEVRAPVVEGLHLWKIRVPESAVRHVESDVEVAHDERSDTFEVRSVPSPDFLVRVEVIDGETGVVLNGASVVMHPYRAVTDDRGVAELRAVSGEYKLQVSRSEYLASSRLIAVTEDVTTSVGLDLQPVLNEDDRYV